MKLFQLPHSTYSRKVECCLKLKGLAFESIEIPYLDRRELAALTGGYVLVPVLEDGGRVIVDSVAITAYLDERYAPTLRPPALAGQAVVFEQWADTLFEDAAFRLSTPLSVAKLVERNGGRADVAGMYRAVKERKYGVGCIEAWRDGDAQLIEKLRAISAPLMQALAAHPFLLGSAPTLADAAVWGPLATVEYVRPGFLRQHLTGLADWYDRVATAKVSA